MRAQRGRGRERREGEIAEKRKVRRGRKKKHLLIILRYKCFEIYLWNGWCTLLTSTMMTMSSIGKHLFLTK
jgi:hypothetical protein